MALETLNNRYGIRHFDEGGSTGAFNIASPNFDVNAFIMGAAASSPSAPAAPSGGDSGGGGGGGFDAGYYLAANPDVAQNWGGDAYSHYVQYGQNEGRAPSAPAAPSGALNIASPDFNVQQFLGSNYVAPAPATRADIEGLYQSIYNRPGDQGGLDYWTNQAQQGASLDAIRGAFYAAPEYRSMSSTPALPSTPTFTDSQVAAYIKDHNLSGVGLTNAMDAFGINAQQLANAQNLIKANDPSIAAASNAYTQAIAGNPNADKENREFYNPETVKQINDWYQTNLDRVADPEGLEYWRKSFGSSLDPEEIKQLQAAPEYTNRQAIIGDIKNYLGPEANLDKVRYYQDQITAGKSLQDVQRQIALSDESIMANAPSVKAVLEATLGKGIVDGLTPEQINEYAKTVLDPTRPGTQMPVSKDQFDADFYLQNNKDVAALGLDPYQHYLEYGINEGRAGNAAPAPFATQAENLLEVYKQIALDPVLGSKLKAENPSLWEQVTPLQRRPDEIISTERIRAGDFGTVKIGGVDVPILNATRADQLLGRDGFGTLIDFSHHRGNQTRDLGWSSNSFSNKLARGAEAIGVIATPYTDEFGKTTYQYQGLDDAARMVGLDTSQFQDKQIQATTKDQYDTDGRLAQKAGEPAFQIDEYGNRTPVMETLSRDQQLYDAINQSAKDIYLYTGDSLTPGKAREGGAESFNTVLYKRSGDELIPISAPVVHGGVQNMDVYRPKDYGFGYYAQGPAFVAAAALSFAMADPSFSLAAAVGSAMLPAAASAAIGTTATGIVGATVLGAAAGALSSTAAGGNIEKGALTGAVTGMVASSMKPLLASESVLKATESIANASQGVFSQAQVGNIIGATIASTLASAASGANGDQILNSFKTSLISSGLSEKAAQLAVAGVKEAFGDDPKTLARTAAATRLVTRTASTAALSGKNPEQIQAAVIATLVQNAGNIAGAGGGTKSATSGFTKAEIDAVNQGAQLANQSGQTQYYELASNITSDQPQPLVGKNDIETSLYDSKYWDTNSQSWRPVPTAGGGGGAGSTSSTGSTADLGKTPTTSELKREFENGTLPSAADVNTALASGSLSKEAAEAYLKAIVDFEKPVIDFSKADDSLNLGISLAVGLIGNGASPQNTINNVSKAVGIDPRIILKAINSNSGVTTKTGNVTTTAGTSTTGTSNTAGTTGTVGGSSTVGPTNVTGGAATTGTQGTGAGTSGAGTGTTGDGTGGGGTGNVDIGIGGTGGTGTGGTGTGTGGGGTGGTGGGGGTGIRTILPRTISPFLLQEYGGIQNLAPGLTGGGNYSLSGIPSTNTNMNPMTPNSPLQQFASTSPVSPLELGAQQQPNQPMQMATGGSTSQQAYNPYDVSSGISGSLTPGLTKARLDYLLTGLPQNKAEGGSIEGHNPQFFSEGGLGSMENTFVEGDGDGTSDQVPAMLANGEFVIPADVVSGLGNGSNDAGAEVLQEFLKAIREHKHSAKADKLPPESKGPLAYLTNAKRKVKVA